MPWTAPSITGALSTGGTGGAGVRVLPSGGSYVSEADADLYFANTFRNAEWTALTSAEKTTALKEATRWLETLCYKGEKCSDTQELKWPRKVDATGCCDAAVCTALPPQMVEATCELALALHNNPTAITGAATSAGTGAVKRQKLDVLEVEYFDSGGSSSSSSRYGKAAPFVLQAFPWLGDMISCWYTSKAGQFRIFRN